MKKYAFPIRAGILALILAGSACSSPEPPSHKVIILGIDGMDPLLLQRYLEEGALPHFQRLIREGDFKPLQTTMPPQSPVAWSTFITGLPPEQHGIFDFLHRDPETMIPEFSMAKTRGSEWNIRLGSWLIPLRGARIERLRKGRAFWEILADHGVPSTIFRMPVNFPPVPAGKALSGMGTPDILGTSGTFSYYTDEWFPDDYSIPGGRIFRVRVNNYSVSSRLVGPPNPYRRETLEEPEGLREISPPMTVDFRVALDPELPLAKIELQDQTFILEQGEWSDWIRVRFEAIPHLSGVAAIARFYLQGVHPDFRLYVSPLQISLDEPAMPITYPATWSRELYEALGYFHTQELPEDTKAFSEGIFSGREFWEQLQFVYREQRRALDHALGNFGEGLLFFYFSSLDQGSHMFWRYNDPSHPMYQYDEVLSKAIPVLYRQMDEALGQVLEAVDDQTTLIVMSDHGFCPFNWEVNLNSWLAEKGYVKFLDSEGAPAGPLFAGVDWARTEAYALGLNGIYVNLAGREKEGIVPVGEAYRKLLARLESDLLDLRDPRNGQNAVSLVLVAGRDYPLDADENSPDLIVGYARGYRTSWQSPLGEFPREIFLDNLDPWSGDHSVDHREVPGILVSNRRITLSEPALHDLTVAVLAEFGVPRPPEMRGRDCLE
jgi:predicted AlkP superfamily phosphohydrolase/phosphomutase